jgi:Telomerase ribonucleoprotein complex - RNA binding domain
MTLAQSLQKIRLKDIPWLKTSCLTGAERVRSTSTHSSSSLNAVDAGVRSPQLTTEQFHCFYFWVFEMFVNPLISSSFYVTEAEGRGSEVHYFRKGVWNRLLKKAREQMGCHFMRICADQTHTQTQIDPRAAHLGGDQSTNNNCLNNSSNNMAKVSTSGSITNDTNTTANTTILKSSTHTGHRGILDLQGAPTVRFVPKKNSLRPITNLKSRPKPGSKAKTARCVLRHHSHHYCHYSLLGPAVLICVTQGEKLLFISLEITDLRTAILSARTDRTGWRVVL